MSEKKRVKVFIGLGSNLGDSKRLLQEAWQALGEVESIELDGLSSPYASEPVDMTSQHWFTNAVGRMQVSLAPLDLLHLLLEVEASFGRTRSDRSFGYQDRSLDLDLLYYGDLQMDSPELTLPHPRIDDRLFVLAPLAELEPDFLPFPGAESVAVRENRLREAIGAGTSGKQEIFHGFWDE